MYTLLVDWLVLANSRTWICLKPLFRYWAIGKNDKLLLVQCVFLADVTRQTCGDVKWRGCSPTREGALPNIEISSSMYSPTNTGRAPLFVIRLQDIGCKCSSRSTEYIVNIDLDLWEQSEIFNLSWIAILKCSLNIQLFKDQTYSNYKFNFATTKSIH